MGILHLKAAVEAHSGDWRQAAFDMKHSLELLESSTAAADSLRTALFLDDYAAILHQLHRDAEARAQRKRARTIKSALRSQ
jgi:hypothetical protein